MKEKFLVAKNIIPSRIAEKIETRIENQDTRSIDLSDIENIQYEFSTDYRTFYGVLATICSTGKLSIKKINGSNVDLSIPTKTLTTHQTLLSK